jgi:hypothetical protein
MYLTVLTQVMTDQRGARLATMVDASAKPVAFSQAYSRCSSSAALEKRLHALVGQLIGAAAPKKPL